VPNQRRPGQTFLGLQVSEELFRLVNEARKKLRMDRSSFVREAVAEKLRNMGYEVPAWIVDPPDRANPELDPAKIVLVPKLPPSAPDPAVNPPLSLRAAEQPEVPPAGPRKKVIYRKSKKA
jgi:hypothetical protein